MEEVASAKGSAFLYVNLKFKCEVRLAGLALYHYQKNRRWGPKLTLKEEFILDGYMYPLRYT